MTKFVIPNRDDDLLAINDDTIYVSELVDIVAEEQEIYGLIRGRVHFCYKKGFFLECRRKATENNQMEWDWVVDYFDTFFAVARTNPQVPWDMRRKLFIVLLDGMFYLCIK